MHSKRKPTKTKHVHSDYIYPSNLVYFVHVSMTMLNIYVEYHFISAIRSIRCSREYRRQAVSRLPSCLMHHARYRIQYNIGLGRLDPLPWPRTQTIKPVQSYLVLAYL